MAEVVVPLDSEFVKQGGLGIGFDGKPIKKRKSAPKKGATSSPKRKKVSAMPDDAADDFFDAAASRATSPQASQATGPTEGVQIHVEGPPDAAPDTNVPWPALEFQKGYFTRDDDQGYYAPFVKRDIDTDVGQFDTDYNKYYMDGETNLYNQPRYLTSPPDEQHPQGIPHLFTGKIAKDWKYTPRDIKIGPGKHIKQIEDKRSAKAKARRPTVEWKNYDQMQPLIDMVLNHRKELKYNPRLTTKGGADVWIKRKNLDGWRAQLQDVNPTDGRNEDEVVVYNAAGIPVYINGYGLAPAQSGVDSMYQRMYPGGLDFKNKKKKSKKQWVKDMLQVQERRTPWDYTYVGNPEPNEFKTLRKWGYNAPRAPPIYLSPSQVWTRVFSALLKQRIKALETEGNPWDSTVYRLYKFGNVMSIASIFFMYYVDTAWYTILDKSDALADIKGTDKLDWQAYKSRTNRKKKTPTKFDLAAIFFYMWMVSQDGKTEFRLSRKMINNMLSTAPVVKTKKGKWASVLQTLEVWLNLGQGDAKYFDKNILPVLRNTKPENKERRSYIMLIYKRRISDMLHKISEDLKELIIKKGVQLPNGYENLPPIDKWKSVIDNYKKQRNVKENNEGELYYEMPQPHFIRGTKNKQAVAQTNQLIEQELQKGESEDEGDDDFEETEYEYDEEEIPQDDLADSDEDEE